MRLTLVNTQIIKTPVADDIRQLVMSPNQDFLAVLTSHTVHICILPDSSHLHIQDTTPFKPKFWTLGPTTHVTSRSAVVSAVWHPLGVNGHALVTVTEDAIVRVWELSTADRWTFDAPTLAIDLKKLADATYLDQDFGVSTSATNKGFSPDAFDMEVAAACFPTRDSGGWAPMTLWLAMTSGDVYALCPLLPQRWTPPPTLIPSLSASIVAKVAAAEDNPESTPEERLVAQQQLEWMSEIDNQEPKLVEEATGEATIEVYTRPSRPGLVPKLQGPFDFDLNPEDEQDDEVELKDIYVIGEKPRVADLMRGEEEELEMMKEDEHNGLSLNIICLLSTSGQVKICLDIDGVEAQWLPPRSKNKRLFAPPPEPPSLLTFQTFDTLKPAEVTPDGWPMFSEDATSPYSFYVTHPAGITYISLTPWVFRLESELQSDSEAGTEFRIDLLAKGQGSERDRIFTQTRTQSPLAAATSIDDPDLGYFILSATQTDPIALFFETPERPVVPKETSVVIPEHVEERPPSPYWEPRPLFHPAEALDKPSAVPAWIDNLRTGRRRPLLTQELRLSMATLEVFHDGHKVVSTEVSDINDAVAELFRKCEALQGELRDQIKKVNEVKNRIHTITGDDLSDDPPVSEDQLIKQRIRVARERQEELANRMERLRKKFGRMTTRELSDKEKAWIEEVQNMATSILGPEAGQGALATTPNLAKQPWKRLEEIKTLRNALMAEAEQLQKVGDDTEESTPASQMPSLKIPSEIRKAKMAQVMSLLERESALVDAVKARIERLSIG
jgi:hypothetical protein